MNRAELRAAIARKGLLMKDISEALGVSPTTLYYKLIGRTEFKESEIRTLVKVLALTPDEVNLIFWDEA